MAAAHRFLGVRGFELIAYGAGAGIVVHGLFGLWIALISRYHRQITGLLCCVAIAAVVYLWKQKVIVDLAKDLSRPIKIFLGLWILFLVLSIAILHLEIRWPSLSSGQFIFKTQTLNVKIQALADGPTDNSIAYLVQEYLLRHIPFQQEHPIVIPGTEVTQRTILMPLVGLAFRAVIDPPPRYQKPLPKFQFDGKAVPAVETLYTDSGFRQFFVISIVLNSLLLLGVGLFCAHLGTTGMLPIAALLFLTNPYFITNTVFTWPKAFAGFFVALAWDAFRRERDTRFVGACSAMAYHCHPYAIAFVIGTGLCCFFGRDPKTRWRDLARFGVTALFLILPWIVWTRLVIELPSGMLSHNFNPGGINTVFPNPIWARFVNVALVFIPAFLFIYPFNPVHIARTASASLAGAAGLILFVPGFMRLLRLPERALLYCGFCLPAAMLMALFGHPNNPMSHGLQPIAAVLLFFGVAQMRDVLKPALFWTLIAVQLLLNCALVAAIGLGIGAHFG